MLKNSEGILTDILPLTMMITKELEELEVKIRQCFFPYGVYSIEL